MENESNNEIQVPLSVVTATPTIEDRLTLLEQRVNSISVKLMELSEYVSNHAATRLRTCDR